MSAPTVHITYAITYAPHCGFVDLPELIRQHPQQYADVAVETAGYEPWERPSRFLEAHLLTTRDWPSGDIDDIDITWTQADYEQLCRICPEADLTTTVIPQEVRDREPGPNDVPLIQEPTP